MAAITFELTDMQDRRFTAQQVLSFTLSCETAAACDGLQLRLFRREPLPEIRHITAFADGKKVFFGYVDDQEETADADGFTTELYARSSACILLDNEALPFTYLAPSAEALFVLHARPFGFTGNLPALYSTADYYVAKGTSCYGAINQLVYGLSGKNLRVSPDNVLYLPDGKTAFTIPADTIIRESRSIRRGNAVSSIDYKTADDTQYRHHIKSRFLERQGIRRSRKLNLAALPEWQQAFTLKRHLENAARTYKSLQLILDGAFIPDLYAPVSWNSPLSGDTEGYVTDAFRITMDHNGVRTHLTLLKQPVLEEISYVA